MTDPTAEFFDGLSRRGHEPLLERVTGAVRFDITRDGRTDHRRVRIDRGDVAVSQDGADADCVVQVDGALFDAIAGGQRNAMAALLRGTIAVQGDPELLVLFQRLFPGPSAVAAVRPVTSAEGRQS